MLDPIVIIAIVVITITMLVFIFSGRMEDNLYSPSVMYDKKNSRVWSGVKLDDDSIYTPIRTTVLPEFDAPTSLTKTRCLFDHEYGKQY
jgi:hypothetical protein